MRILSAMPSTSVGYGHASESLAYVLTGASVRGSSVNVASKQNTPLGSHFNKVCSTMSVLIRMCR